MLESANSRSRVDTSTENAMRRVESPPCRRVSDAPPKPGQLLSATREVRQKISGIFEKVKTPE